MHNNANETSVTWHDVTHDGNSQRITIPKRLISLYFFSILGAIFFKICYTGGFILL